jgi:hypothetical protein
MGPLCPDWPDYSKKSYLTNEKELEHSEDDPWGFVGTIRRPGHFPGCYFAQVLRREKATRPHVGSKVEPAVHTEFYPARG